MEATKDRPEREIKAPDSPQKMSGELENMDGMEDMEAME
jgi:hypothetical protein